MLKRLITVLIILLAISTTATAYTIPVEYREQVRNDIDLYKLMQNHYGEAWVEPILDDMTWHYVGYGRDKLDIKMQSMMIAKIRE